MLLQTNSYIVPKEKRAEHARLLRRFRQTLLRLGCDHFEAYEQVGANWTHGETTGRYVQIMRFKDRKHQLAVQAAERADPTAQALINEFCEQINFTYQQQQGLFAVGYYTSMLPPAPGRMISPEEGQVLAESAQIESAPVEAPVDEEVEEELLEAAAGDGEPGLHTLTGGPVGESEEFEEEILGANDQAAEVPAEAGEELLTEEHAETDEPLIEDVTEQTTEDDQQQQPQGGR